MACIEGCGNLLSPSDRNRCPESLSRPRPPAQQNAYSNMIDRVNMRLRCSQCYHSKYHRRYTTISYRWDFSDRREAGIVVYAHDETTTTTTTVHVKIPITKRAQFNVIMSCPLFFLDVLNASSGSRQWTPGKLSDTYTSSARQICLLNSSDQRIIERNREHSIHQTLVPRDRGPYLDSKYGKTERFAAYCSLPPSDVVFVNIYGEAIENIEASGLVKGHRNVYDQVAAYGDMDPGSYNRSVGPRLARAIPADKRDPKKKKKQLRGHIPQSFFELNPYRISGPQDDGKLPTPTPTQPVVDSTLSDAMGGLSIGSQIPVDTESFPLSSGSVGAALGEESAEAFGSQALTPFSSFPIDAGLGSGQMPTGLDAGTVGEGYTYAFGSQHLTSFTSFPTDTGLSSDCMPDFSTFPTSSDLGGTGAFGQQYLDHNGNPYFP